MRKEFAEALHAQMKKNDKIWLVTADLGFGLFDKIRDDFPNRFINAGAAEQAAMGICVGLAMEGQIPLFYSITPFALFRPAETIRIYINGENIPVKIIGSGRDNDYSHDGPSHHAYDAKEILKVFPNIKQYWPTEAKYVAEVLNYMLYNDKPSFMSIKRQ